MNRKNTLTVYLVMAAVILFTLTNIFINREPLKTICNIITAVTAVFGIITKFLPKNPLSRRVRKIKIVELLIGEKKNEAIVSGEPFNRFKSELLSFTQETIKKRIDLINDPEIFSFEFPVTKKFHPGSRPENTLKEWETNLHHQFVFITGKSGSGKTYELVKRASHLCDKLSAGLTNPSLLKDEKIPLYIELKTLDREMDTEWIVEYIQKSANISNKQFKDSQIESLINGAGVIYFFDGLDEIGDELRKSCVQFFIALSKDTGVHVTCRKQIFEGLDKTGDLKRDRFPAEFSLEPISPQQVKAIIQSSTDRSAEEKNAMIEFISNKPNLLQHMGRPIFLNLFLIVYSSITGEQKKILDTGDEQTTMDILWENYEDIIYKKKMPKDIDTLGIRTISVWLAKIMGENAFYIESIQPSWLSKISHDKRVEFKSLQRLYFFSTRILAAVIIGVAFGCLISTPFALVSNSVLGGIVIAVLAGIYNMPIVTRVMPLWLSSTLFSIIMIATLVFVCGTYQGFSVPRAEMTTRYFSIFETWPGVLLGLALSIIFSYRIILEKKKTQYILPIELFHFDWPHAIRYGLSWGLTSGVIVGCIALYVRTRFADAIFIKTWLTPRLENLIQHVSGTAVTDRTLNIAIFSYAFLITFFVASIIIILLAGRYNDKEETNNEKKQQLNFAIRQSARHAFIHSLKVSALVIIMYYLAMIKFGMGNIFHLTKITVGVSMLAFLWFGGMEVINHIILRINLYIRGIAPLNYDTWVQRQQDMGIIIPTGYQLKFYHNSLAGYYDRYRLTNNPRIRLIRNTSKDVNFYILVLLLSVALLLVPFLMRYDFQWYWKCGTEVNSSLKGVDRVNDSVYYIPGTGVYDVSAEGYIHVGTFVGYAIPGGIKYGFMGMPLDSAYNVPGFEHFRHAALLMRTKNKNNPWSDYRYVTDAKRMSLQAGDTIQLMVNDKEPQNNIGRYNFIMNYCDTCKNRLR